MKLKRLGGKAYTLFKTDGELNDKLPKNLRNKLGPTSEEVIKSNDDEVTRRTEKVRELRSSREQATKNQRDTIDHNIDEQMGEIDRLVRENENIEQRMSLRDRIKEVFKKYGFTAFAVLSAVGVVIGVIVANLKSGVQTLGKGIGGGPSVKAWRDTARNDRCNS